MSLVARIEKLEQQCEPPIVREIEGLLLVLSSFPDGEEIVTHILAEEEKSACEP
jgi:hypothetical protein